MVIKSSELVWISVSDQKKAKKLFVDLLGLKVNEESPEHNWMELAGPDGGALIGVAGPQGEEPEDETSLRPGENAIISLTCENLEETKKRLETGGVNFLGEVMEIPGHVKMAMFTDDDGNKFQIVQLLDNHPRKK